MVPYMWQNRWVMRVIITIQEDPLSTREHVVNQLTACDERFMVTMIILTATIFSPLYMIVLKDTTVVTIGLEKRRPVCESSFGNQQQVQQCQQLPVSSHEHGELRRETVPWRMFHLHDAKFQ
jgi:hypothetical protein